MQKPFLLLSALTSLIFLAGCNAPLPLAMAEMGGMYATAPGEKSPADTADQIAPHESWCYQTLGDVVECYAEPQDTPPGRLVNVDPANKYPLTRKAYAETLAQSQRANAPKVVATDTDGAPILPAAVQAAEVKPVLPVAAKAQSAPPKAAKKTAKHKKHKKQAANACLCADKDKPTEQPKAGVPAKPAIEP